MEEETIIDRPEESTTIEFSARNVTTVIVKGVIAFVLCISMTVFYLWCNSNMLAFTSGRANSIVNGLIIYALLLVLYSVTSVLLGVKMKENSIKSVQRLEMISIIIQGVIAILLLSDWWFTFEINVL